MPDPIDDAAAARALGAASRAFPRLAGLGPRLERRTTVAVAFSDEALASSEPDRAAFEAAALEAYDRERSAEPVVLGTDRYVVRALVLLAAAGILARLLIAAHWVGTQDVSECEAHGRRVRELGLLSLYTGESSFNSPPLVGYLLASISWIAEVTRLPFHFVFKLPAIVADALTAGLLYGIGSERAGPRAGAIALALGALNPTSVLVSGFNGSIDSVFVFFTLLAVALAERKRPLHAGLAIGAALNVRLIPVFVVPALAFRCRSRDELQKLAAGLALALLTYVPPLLAGPGFVKHVLGYGSFFERWGVLLFLGWGLPRTQLALDLFRAEGRWVIVGAVLLLCAHLWRSESVSRSRLAAAAQATFLIFASGFGVQYLVAVVPLLIVVEPTTALLFSTLGGCTAAIQYGTDLDSAGVAVHSGLLPLAAVPFALLAWAVLVSFVCRTVALANKPG